MDTKRLQQYIGVGLVVVAVLLFLYTFFVNLPSKDAVNQTAKTLPAIPADLFSSSNPVSQKLTGLSVPSGVPVVVDPSTVGRVNVFQNF